MLLILELEFKSDFCKNYFLLQNIQFDSNNVCDLEIQFSNGVLTLTSVCKSVKQELLRWVDSDPLDVVYYSFGSEKMESEFYVHTGKTLVFSFLI
jgi:hypothetical protein